jgi:hypothetical protein
MGTVLPGHDSDLDCVLLAVKVLCAEHCIDAGLERRFVEDAQGRRQRYRSRDWRDGPVRKREAGTLW